MNALTQTPQSQPYRGSSAVADIGMELTKMLALVAPVTMTSEQQELWLRAAIDSLRDIRPSEIAEVSMEVRRSATRPAQIVPEIARLVAQRRERQTSHISVPMIEGPPPKKPVMDRRGEPMSEEDTAELNGILEKLGAMARYRPDGSRYFIESRA